MLPLHIRRPADRFVTATAHELDTHGASARSFGGRLELI